MSHNIWKAPPLANQPTDNTGSRITIRKVANQRTTLVTTWQQCANHCWLPAPSLDILDEHLVVGLRINGLSNDAAIDICSHHCSCVFISSCTLCWWLWVISKCMLPWWWWCESVRLGTTKNKLYELFAWGWSCWVEWIVAHIGIATASMCTQFNCKHYKGSMSQANSRLTSL